MDLPPFFAELQRHLASGYVDADVGGVGPIDGGVVDGVLTASSSKVSRLELTCTKERASQWKQTVKDIEVLLECEGERYPVLIKGRFQW